MTRRSTAPARCAAGLGCMGCTQWEGLLACSPAAYHPRPPKTNQNLPPQAPEQVNSALFSWVAPTPTGTEPTTLAASAAVARLVGLDPEEARRPEFALIFSGAGAGRGQGRRAGRGGTGHGGLAGLQRA